MIIKESIVKVDKIDCNQSLVYSKEDIEINNVFENALFFDLEHYIYKKPICIGVFGCCYYEKAEGVLKVTQYMIENQSDVPKILVLAKDYFSKSYKNLNKSYMVTFSGNNDYLVINKLFEKYNIDFNIAEHFIDIDLQKQYEKQTKLPTGLKALEKVFEINRETELISGSTLAKTFCKIVKDEGYFSRMPEQKIEKILLYNEQDVVSLFEILVKWKDFVKEKVISDIPEPVEISNSEN